MPRDRLSQPPTALSPSLSIHPIANSPLQRVSAAIAAGQFSVALTPPQVKYPPNPPIPARRAVLVAIEIDLAAPAMDLSPGDLWGDHTTYISEDDS